MATAIRDLHSTGSEHRLLDQLQLERIDYTGGGIANGEIDFDGFSGAVSRSVCFKEAHHRSLRAAATAKNLVRLKR